MLGHKRLRIYIKSPPRILLIRALPSLLIERLRASLHLTIEHGLVLAHLSRGTGEGSLLHAAHEVLVDAQVS